MKRFQQIIIIGGLSLMTLVGCSNAEQTSTQTSPVANSTTETTTTTGAKTDFTGLLTVVNNTNKAVSAGDFKKAKTEFDNFENYWSKVEDGVKAKSAKTYKNIEDQTDQVKAGLKAAKPNKGKIVATLQSLNKEITAVAK